MNSWQIYYLKGVGVAGSTKAPRLFAGSQDNGAMCSDDGGQTWTYAGAPDGNGCGDLFDLAIAPSNQNRVYSASCAEGIERSDNAMSAATCADVRWTTYPSSGGPAINAGLGRNLLAVSPANADLVFTVGYGSVWASADGGVSWTRRMLPPSSNGSFAPTTAMVDGNGVLYVGTEGGGVFSSSDGGATWAPAGLNSSSPAVVSQLAWSKTGDVLYAATTDGLFRRRAGAWASVAPSAGTAVSAVHVDPVCSGRVYAAYGHLSLYGQQGGEAIVSGDFGDHWQNISSAYNATDVNRAPVTSIQVDPVTPKDVFFATYGRGGWMFDLGGLSGPSCPNP